MERISITTNKVIQSLEGVLQPTQSALLQENLKKVLTKKEQEHIRYYSINSSSVIIGIDSSVWLYMLSLKRRQLSAQIAQTLNKDQSSVKIVFRLASKSQG